MNKLNNPIQRTIDKLSVASDIIENKYIENEQHDPQLLECYHIINDVIDILKTERWLCQLQHDSLMKYVDKEFEDENGW